MIIQIQSSLLREFYTFIGQIFATCLDLMVERVFLPPQNIWQYIWEKAETQAANDRNKFDLDDCTNKGSEIQNNQGYTVREQLHHPGTPGNRIQLK